MMAMIQLRQLLGLIMVPIIQELVTASDTNASGCITIQFTSNATGTTTGWEADIICAVPCQTITPSIDSADPAITTSGSIQANVGESYNI